MTEFTRRQLLRGTAHAGVAASGLVAFSPSARALQDFNGQTISHWSFLSPTGKSQREVAIKEIEEKFRAKTGINVNVQVFPWQEMGTKLIAAVQAAAPPDSARVNLFHLKMILTADGLTNLDPYVAKTYSAEQKKDFVIDFTPAMVVNGSKWSMQLEAVPKALFVRKDWLTKAGLKAPKTWDEFVAVGKAFTGDGKWGYMFGASKTQLNQVETIFQPQIHGRGGQILDASEKATFNDEASIAAYRFVSDCVLKHKITPPQVLSMTYDDVMDAFKAGRVGMIQEGAHRYNDIVKAVGVENIELVKVPSNDPARPSPTIITGWGIGIPRGSKHVDASWEYIKYYMSDEAQEINARLAGTFPSRLSVLNQPYFKSPEAAYFRWWMDYVAERSETVINVASFGQLNEVMTDALHQILLNPSSDIKTVLDAAVNRYNDLVQL
jgi:ABC-type glycerol-3-phosphate transport system substrate-binding protein